MGVFLQGVLKERTVQCWGACGNNLGFETGKHTQWEAPSLGSCRDGPPRGAAACEPSDAVPRSAAAAAAASAAAVVGVGAAVTAAAAAAAVSADGDDGAAAAAGASLGLHERQMYWAVNAAQHWECEL